MVFPRAHALEKQKEAGLLSIQAVVDSSGMFQRPLCRFMMQKRLGVSRPKKKSRKGAQAVGAKTPGACVL